MEDWTKRVKECKTKEDVVNLIRVWIEDGMRVMNENVRCANQTGVVMNSGYLNCLAHLDSLMNTFDEYFDVNIEPIIGYNSYGRWDSLRHIKELELDRGNEWFDDSSYDLDKDEAIWVTKDPGVALRYPYSSILWDLKPGDKAPEGFEQEWDEFQAKLRDPTPYVVKVDLTGAEEVLSDGDGGWLYVRRRK